ncbi:uncharacterized protein LOC126680510 [Mercurialis annua]|uniref:uncharacterized protein LOC126680510 n=1 Tax=Mercurialis annua TaxID=3986 RepID=UPI00215E77C6|nr:uncharacterized protein LOC126680510 [Mercurialis annua]
MKQEQNMGFKRGGIIWAKVRIHPQKWRPAIVLSIKAHWVLVSFFTNSSRYILDTDVCSFQENYESLVKTVEKGSKGDKLLDFALKLIASKVYSSLKCCSCHFLISRREAEIPRREKLFQSGAVLGFVLDVAVEPFVGDSDLIYAVGMAAKIHAFRRFIVGKPVAQKSDTPQLDFKLPNKDQTDFRSWNETELTKTPSVHEMLLMLRSLALDSQYLNRQCLSTVKKNVLFFRNSVCQTGLNSMFEKSSHSHSSSCRPRYIRSLDGNNGRNVLALMKPYAASSINFSELKRPYDDHIDSDFCYKRYKTKHLSSSNGANVNIEEEKTKDNIRLCDALISKPALSDIFLRFFNGAYDFLHRFRIRSKSSTSSASAETIKYLPAPDPTDHYSTDTITYANIRGSSIDDRKHETQVSSDVTVIPEEVEKQSGLDALWDSDYLNLHIKFPKDSNLPSKEDLIRKFSRFGKIDSHKTKICTRLRSAQVVFLSHLDAATAYQYAKRKKVLYGGGNVLFWLRPDEKRSESKFRVPSPSIKSCLKKSDKEDKRHAKRVKFIMETNDEP